MVWFIGDLSGFEFGCDDWGDFWCGWWFWYGKDGIVVNYCWFELVFFWVYLGVWGGFLVVFGN